MPLSFSVVAGHGSAHKQTWLRPFSSMGRDGTDPVHEWRQWKLLRETDCDIRDEGCGVRVFRHGLVEQDRQCMSRVQ